jgi:hypothetical protein
MFQVSQDKEAACLHHIYQTEGSGKLRQVLTLFYYAPYVHAQLLKSQAKI